MVILFLLWAAIARVDQHRLADGRKAGLLKGMVRAGRRAVAAGPRAADGIHKARAANS